MNTPAAVAAQLAAMPAWADVRPGAAQQLAEVEASVQALAMCPPPIVLAGALDHARSFGAPGARPYGVSEMSRLFVLHRWLFELPPSVPAGGHGFGGFLGKPVVDGQLLLRWPWSAASDGRLVLTGYFAGYSGEAFDAVAEANEFMARYGLRKPR